MITMNGLIDQVNEFGDLDLSVWQRSDFVFRVSPIVDEEMESSIGSKLFDDERITRFKTTYETNYTTI